MFYQKILFASAVLFAVSRMGVAQEVSCSDLNPACCGTVEASSMQPSPSMDELEIQQDANPRKIFASQEEPEAEVSAVGMEVEREIDQAESATADSNTIGFAKGTGIAAFTNKSRAQHAARHLTEAGILPNWSSATYELFKEMGVRIVESPLKIFDHRLGATAVKGYYGTVDGKDVVMLIYEEGNYTGLIATSFVPSPQQMINWGLK